MEPEKTGWDINGTLDDMRAAYWQGLFDQEETTGEILECLLFTLGGKSFAFETHFAAEVLRVPKLVRVPAVQELVAGIFSLRGEITAAMDIRPLLALERREISQAGRLVVVKGERFATGLVVERAQGVQELAFERFEPADPGSADNRFVRGHFDAAGDRVALLDLPALLAAPELVIGG